MPGFTTHYLFGVDAYHRITNSCIRQNLYKNHCAFGLGLQGPDLFFYYLPSYLLHKKNLGALAHDQDTGAFFAYLLESRNLFAGNPRKLAIADAYLCGFLGHYTLDCAAHPFIYAFTNFSPDAPLSNSNYFGQHAYLETEIDKTLLYEKKQLSPSAFHQEQTIFLSPLQKHVIAQMLVYAYRNTYPQYFTHKEIMYEAFFWMKLGTKLLNDPSGQKKVIARLLERIIVGRAFISPMVPSDRHRFVADPMNTSHRKWNHPWKPNAVSTDSFYDIYERAGKLYDKRLKKFFCLTLHGCEETETRKFLNSYGNRSFLSGEPLI